jgi:hypothetical protein
MLTMTNLFHKGDVDPDFQVENDAGKHVAHPNHWAWGAPGGRCFLNGQTRYCSGHRRDWLQTFPPAPISQRAFWLHTEWINSGAYLNPIGEWLTLRSQPL